MKFIHLADLHLGKKIGDYNLDLVQKDALNQVVELIKDKDIDACVIAGDIYDSKNPTVEAYNILDEFLYKLHKLNKKVLMISGNHDQEDKLNFGSKIFQNDGIYINCNVSNSINPIIIDDVNFYLLPFVNKYDIKSAFNLDETLDLNESLKLVIDKMNIDKTKKNVIVSHQAVVGSTRVSPSGSEVSISVDSEGYIGGEDIVSANIYKDFNYCALGHIHKAYNVDKHMRYPGALLKYHKDEANYKKTFTIVDTADFSIEEIPFKPLQDVVLLSGSYEEIKTKVEYKNDFVFFKLTDSNYILDVMSKLKTIFKYACSISYSDVKNNYNNTKIYENIDKVSKFDLFNDLYKSKIGNDLNQNQIDIVKNAIKQIWDEE